MSKKEKRNAFAIEKEAMKALVNRAGSSDRKVAEAAQAEFAQAVETPLRQVLLSGDIVNGIYSPEDFTQNPNVMYPLDLITPGQERDFYAYVIPSHGTIPMRRVESDYLMIPTYKVGNAIDCTLDYLRDANWPVITRMLEVMEAGFIKKMNDDGWQTILTAATDRNIIVNDPDASSGQFTPRLVTLLKTVMRRNAGGNSATLNRGRLTDLFVSPESVDDAHAWGLNLVPDDVRSQIFYSSDNGELNVFNVNIRGLDELGEGQDYQTYYTSTLSGTMDASDVEICVGLDLQREDSFVHPIRDALKVFEDNTVHRQGLFSLYGWSKVGFAVLDSRRTLLASC